MRRNIQVIQYKLIERTQRLRTTLVDLGERELDNYTVIEGKGKGRGYRWGICPCVGCSIRSSWVLIHGCVVLYAI